MGDVSVDGAHESGYQDIGPHIYREAFRRAHGDADRQDFYEAYVRARALNLRIFRESFQHAKAWRAPDFSVPADEIADFVIYDARNKDDPEWKDENIARRKKDPVHQDYIVNAAHDNITHSFKFYLKALAINSLDGKGMPIKAAVHVGKNYNNSYYTEGTVNFGDGNGMLFKDDAKDLTVVAHELGHGIVDYLLGGLIYWGQSGALNESLADILGVSAMQYVLGEKAVPESTWLFNQIGMVPYEDENGKIIHPALRSLKAPGTAYVNHPIIGTDPQPADMGKYYDGAQDNYGVHINSGIPNRAFYLAATALGGRGWDIALPIWIETARVLPAKTSFKDFAKKTLEVAEQLFPNRVDVKRSIRQAWNKVRVLGQRAVEVDEVYELTPEVEEALGLDPQVVTALRDTVAKATPDLLKIPDVLYVAPGFEIDENLYIKLEVVVYVSRRKRDWQEIPDEINGYPVKVVYREWSGEILE